MSKNSQERQLGAWFVTQGKAYRNGKLSKDRIEKLEQLPGWKWDRSNNYASANKKKLLEMARNGEPKPHGKKTRLGTALRSYTEMSHNSYDPKFKIEIEQLAPAWFARKNRACQNKKDLLEMARNGRPKPRHKTRLLLIRYTHESSRCYDPEFKAAIAKAAPRWLGTSMADKKARLLEMARNGESRPSDGTELKRALDQSFYKASRDPEFIEQILKLAPHWRTPSVKENKRQLLEMARNREPKPPYGTKLGTALHNYKQDKEFWEQIIKLAPQWEVGENSKKNSKKRMERNKEQLLEMAQNGEPRPSFETKLGRALNKYRDHAEFKEIRKLAPHWFRGPYRKAK